MTTRRAQFTEVEVRRALKAAKVDYRYIHTVGVAGSIPAAPTSLSAKFTVFWIVPLVNQMTRTVC